MIGLAAIRPDEWNLPVFLHVLGALTLIGAITLTAVFLFSALHRGSEGSLRLAVRSLLLGVLPAWVLMRASAQWIADKEGFADLDKPPAWINIGFIAGEGGLLLILIAGISGWLGLRKQRAGGGGTATSVRVAAVVISLLLILNLVTLWAMTTKPS